MKPVKIPAKPLSVNQVWQGRRFKTQTYVSYEDTILALLPRLKVPAGKLVLKIKWGFSNKASDLDNPVKPLMDILQKAYGFNDKLVYRLEVEKVDIKKGEEFIEFQLEQFT